MAMIGRLEPSVTPQAAHAEVRTIAAQLSAEHAGRRNGFEGNVKPLRDHGVLFFAGTGTPAIFTETEPRQRRQLGYYP